VGEEREDEMHIQIALTQDEMSGLLTKALNARHGTSGKWAIDYHMLADGTIEVRAGQMSLDEETEEP